MKRVAIYLVGAIAVVAIVFILGSLNGRVPATPASTPPPLEAPTTTPAPSTPTVVADVNAPAAGFSVVSSDDNSIRAITRELSSYSGDELAALPWNKRVTINAVIDGDITQAQVRPTLLAIVNQATAGDSDIDEVTVFLYSEAGSIGGGWDVGSALWAPGGERGRVTPEIASSNDRASYQMTTEERTNVEAYLAARSNSEERFGLTLEQRKAFFLDMSLAEVRSFRDADARINPSTDVMGNIRLSNQLREQYRSEVTQAHGVDPSNVGAILLEGQQMNWPMR